MEAFEILKDIKDSVAYMLKAPEDTDNFNVAMAADTNVALSVPAAAINGVAVFRVSQGLDFYVSPTEITLPVNTSFAADDNYLNPPGLWLNGQTTLNFRSESAVNINVQFYTRLG